MLMEVDAQIVHLSSQGLHRDDVCTRLHVGPNRVFRFLTFFGKLNITATRVSSMSEKGYTNDL
jgi:hypothetical protein